MLIQQPSSDVALKNPQPIENPLQDSFQPKKEEQALEKPQVVSEEKRDPVADIEIKAEEPLLEKKRWGIFRIGKKKN